MEDKTIVAKMSKPAREQGKLPRAVGYLRVSAVGTRDVEAENYQTEATQRAIVERLAGRLGVRVTEWQLDRDESGGNADRAGFNAAIEAVEARRAEWVLTAYQSRWGRSMLDGEAGVRRIEDAGGLFLADDVGVDPRTDAGIQLRQMRTMQAESELRRFKAQWSGAKTNALARGVYLAKTAPVGYRFDKGRRLVKSHYAPAVKRLFTLAAADASLAAMVNHLKEATGHTYYESSIGHMLKNRAYVGDTVYNGETFPGTHEAIVTEDEWLAAQRTPKPRLKRSGTGSLLAGIARCASCGRKMARDNSGSVPIYKCPRKPIGECKNPASISMNVLDEYVVENVLAWAHDEGLDTREHEVRPEDELTAARAVLRRADEALEAFVVDSADLRLSRDLVRKGLETRQEAVSRAAGRVAELEQLSRAATVRTSLAAVWPELTVPERRQLIGSVIERVSVARRQRGIPSRIEDRAVLVWFPEDGRDGA